uniref:Uncharacterized protein n=1 Tax=Siphoviridae sp. ctwHj1 TaxID=2825727 RepID=A0A8S5U658_9CAUD|nr:MAG TPA: hypothetical protein [Siphoviridae sp. ctwHj1]
MYPHALIGAWNQLFTCCSLCAAMYGASAFSFPANLCRFGRATVRLNTRLPRLWSGGAWKG